MATTTYTAGTLYETTAGESYWYTNPVPETNATTVPGQWTTTTGTYYETPMNSRVALLEARIQALDAKYERLIRAIESRGLRIDFEF